MFDDFVKLFIALIIGMCLTLPSCGQVEKIYENSNYESITNERGDLELYSGGKLIKTLKNGKIIYSDSDSFAMWIKLNDGSKVYWQGEAYIMLK